MLSNAQIEDFHSNGFLVIKEFYDTENEIEPIQYYIYHIIGMLIKREGLLCAREPFSPETFDTGFQKLIEHDRRLGGVVYDAIKQIPGFIRLLSSKKHELVYESIFGCSFPAIGSGSQGIRIDIPFETRFSAPWHQEYLANLRSKEGLTFWSPLLNMSQEMGPVEFCVGSHKGGVFPVRLRDKKNPHKKGAEAMVIAREEGIVASYATNSPILSCGDVLLADWLVLHRSGVNVSNRCRWSMQMRHFSFDNKVGISNNWIGSFANGVSIDLVHPEYIVTD